MWSQTPTHYVLIFLEMLNIDTFAEASLLHGTKHTSFMSIVLIGGKSVLSSVTINDYIVN